MARRAARRRAATAADARMRFESAQAFLEVADLVLTDDEGAALPGVAAGLAVLAGIAASDAICARRLGEIHRGDDHGAASDLLATATADGRELARTFRRLIDLKDEAHYGITLLSRQRARNAVRWASTLVERARQELQR